MGAIFAGIFKAVKVLKKAKLSKFIKHLKYPNKVFRRNAIRTINQFRNAGLAKVEKGLLSKIQKGILSPERAKKILEILERNVKGNAHIHDGIRDTIADLLSTRAVLKQELIKTGNEAFGDVFYALGSHVVMEVLNVEEREITRRAVHDRYVYRSYEDVIL